MANNQTTINKSDIKQTRTLLHEHIPLTGSLLSGTYESNDVDENVKNFSHGMFQVVMDYPYLSSSANHLFDITCGYSNASALSGASNTQNDKKINIYNQMAQVLAGHDHTGSILRFDQDGQTVDTGTKMDEVFFLNFSRLLVKDEIKKGTFELELGVTSDHDYGGATFNERIKITDVSGSNSYKVNSPAGEYGILFATASAGAVVGSGHSAGNVLSSSLEDDGVGQPPCGLLYYQTGIAVLSGSIFTSNGTATATLVMADGDLATNGQFTEGEIVTITSTDGTTRVYVLCDGSESGASATGTVLTEGSDTGASTLTAATAAKGTCVAVLNNLNTHSQAVVLNEIKAAIVHANGHNGKITASDDVSVADGEQTITLTQAVKGIGGNVTITTDISQLTVSGFSGAQDTLDNILQATVDMSTTETGTESFSDILTGSSIQTFADALRNRIYNIQFNNTTELNSTIYFCRVNHNDYNYSTNPTYLTGGQLRVKVDAADSPVSYITTVGLYNANDELLAVAKTSEPLVKTPEDELTIRVRLDY